jgi:hypothetical protein
MPKEMRGPGETNAHEISNLVYDKGHTSVRWEGQPSERFSRILNPIRRYCLGGLVGVAGMCDPVKRNRSGLREASYSWFVNELN